MYLQGKWDRMFEIHMLFENPDHHTYREYIA